MRYLFLVFTIFIVYNCYPQPNGNVILSGIVVDTDSIPIPDVAIMNIRTYKTVRTNADGFFQTEIAAEDSLLAFHIAYKKRYISERNNARYIVMEPEIQELNQVNITNKYEQEQENLKETVKDIKRLAPLKKITEYDMKSRQNKFIDANGSHNKGFSPFFGPTIHSPIAKIATLVAGSEEKRQRKKMTSHYHLEKKKK